MKGTSSEEQVKKKILDLASDEEDHTSSYFVNKMTGEAAKNTVLKYLKELMRGPNKLLDAHLDDGNLKPKIRINEKGLLEVEKNKLKNTLNEQIDIIYEKEKEELKARIRNLEKMVDRFHDVIDHLQRKQLDGRK